MVGGRRCELINQVARINSHGSPCMHIVQCPHCPHPRPKRSLHLAKKSSVVSQGSPAFCSALCASCLRCCPPTRCRAYPHPEPWPQASLQPRVCLERMSCTYITAC